MKKKLIYLIAILSFATLTGCADFLDVKSPSDINQKDYYKTLNDFEGALNGCYAILHDLYSKPVPVLGEAGTDEAFLSEKRKEEKHLDDYYSLNSSNEIVSNFWRLSYEGINRCNLILSQIENLDSSSERVDGIIGETEFLLGLHYFNLVRVFGAVPLKTTPSRSSDNFAAIKRDSVSVVYKYIFEVLEDAYDMMDEQEFNGQKGRADAYAASGLLAKAYLQAASCMNNLQPKLTGNLQLGGLNSFEWTETDMDGNEMTPAETMAYYYEQAADFAEITMDYYGGEDCLVPGTLIGHFYPEESTRDVLFEVMFAQNTTPNSGSGFGFMFGPYGKVAQGSGYNYIRLNGCVVIPNFTCECKNGVWSSVDDRFLWAVSTYQLDKTTGEEQPLGNNMSKSCRSFAINKFKPSRLDIPSHALGTGANNPVLRLSDVCLVYAEALAELSWIETGTVSEDAIHYLNIVRKNAHAVEYTIDDIRTAEKIVAHQNPQDIPLKNKELKGYETKSDIEHFRRTILNERMLELLGEGHRWFDLVRMGVLKDVVNATDAFDPHGDLHRGLKVVKDFHVFRPVPLREIQLHHDNLIQNEGYY